MARSNHRDRAVNRYLVPLYGLLKSPAIGLVRVVVSTIGTFGLIGTFLLGTAAGQPNNPINFRKATVFAAAPINWIFKVPPKVAFCKKKAPPPYRIVVLTKRSLRDVTPSSSNIWSKYSLPSAIIRGAGGTVGVKTLPFNGSGAGVFVWAKDHGTKNCRVVDVWGLNDPSKPANSIPSTNEPSGMVVFRITPPSSGNAGNCTEWKYHDGEAPQKPKRIIRPKKQKQQSSLVGRRNRLYHRMCLVI
jgi:hypothetical protein